MGVLLSMNVNKVFVYFCCTLGVYIYEWGQEGEEECPICLERFIENEQVATLECSHEFHFSCVRRWAEVS